MAYHRHCPSLFVSAWPFANKTKTDPNKDAP
jgi:hypothetical protein